MLNHSMRVLVVVATLALASVAGASAAELSREVKCGAGKLLADGPALGGCAGR